MLYCRGELGPQRPLQSCTQLVIIRHWDLQYDFVNLWHSCLHISNYGNNSLLQQQQLHEFFGDAASTGSRRLYGAFFTMIVYGSSCTSTETPPSLTTISPWLSLGSWTREGRSRGGGRGGGNGVPSRAESSLCQRFPWTRPRLVVRFPVDGPDASDRYRSRGIAGVFRWEARPRITVYGSNWTVQMHPIGTPHLGHMFDRF